MAARLLGIEYTDDQIRVVEVSFGRRLKVFNFAVIDNRSVDPERRVEQFNHTLQVRGFEAKDALVAASGGNVEHRLLTLPPLSGREMHFVMQRESKKLAPTGMAEMLWSYEILKAKEELGIKKNQILLVTAERPMVDTVQTFIAQTRLKLLQVSTIPEAVLNLLRCVGGWKKETVRTIVHFAGDLVHILFAQDGVLLLSREIRFDYVDMGQDEQVERLVNELKRSTLYFRQNFPQAQLDKIVFSGGNDILGTLATRSSQELGIEGSIIRFEENLDTSGFRGNFDEFRFHLPAMAAALGVAWRKTPGTSGINLLPGKSQAKQQGVNPARIARIACAAAVTISLGTGVYYIREKGRIDAGRQDAASRAAIVDPKLQQVSETAQRQSAAAQRVDFLDRLGPRVQWAELLRGLSFLVPDTAVFESIRVEGGEQLKLTIRGRVSAASPLEANADFTRFFRDLRGLPFLKSVSMPASPTVTSEEFSGPTPVSVQMQSKVSFEIVCVLL